MKPTSAIIDQEHNSHRGGSPNKSKEKMVGQQIRMVYTPVQVVRRPEGVEVKRQVFRR